jgi:hypothetical protein
VSLLEVEAERRKQRADESEARLAAVEKEFESYKVRAASVLRQAKDKVKQDEAFAAWSGLPDGMVSNQNSQSW